MILVLGRPVVVVDGVQVRPGRRMARALLGLLALRPNRVHPVEWIIDSLWPQRVPASAAANVRSHLAELRRLLPGTGPRIERSGEGYILLSGQNGVDASWFVGLVERARVLRADGSETDAADALTTGLGLWRGAVLDGVPIPEAVRSDAAVLDELRITAAEDLVDLRMAMGQQHDLVPTLTGLVIDYPLRERLWHQLMLALAATGRRGEAMGAYHRLVRLLECELGVRPSPETTDLYQSIQREASC